MPICIKFNRSADHGTIGCTVGLAPHIFVGAYGSDPVDALHQAAELAAKMKQTLDEHPELKAALSLVPGGSAALTAIASASELLKNGGTIAQVAKNVGPNVAAVVKGILSVL